MSRIPRALTSWCDDCSTNVVPAGPVGRRICPWCDKPISEAPLLKRTPPRPPAQPPAAERRRPPDLMAKLAEAEQAAVLVGVSEDVGEAIRALQRDSMRYARDYFEWWRSGRGANPPGPGSLPLDVAAVVRDRVQERHVAVRLARRAAA